MASAMAEFTRLAQQVHDLNQAAVADIEVPNEAKLGPTDWAELVGQTDLRETLRVWIVGARSRGGRMHHVLLSGQPGTGKTTVSELIAHELGRPLVKFTKPPEPWKLRSTLSRLNREKGVLFVDEIHQWSRTAKDGGQHDLMQLTEEGTLDSSGGVLQFHDVTVIAATTEPDKILGPLLQRFKCPRLVPYTVAEMGQIVTGMAERAGVELDEDTVALLAGASAGVPRNARSMVQDAADLAADGQVPDGATILSFCHVDPDGMTDNHLAYLRLLSRGRGTAGLSTIAGRLQMPETEVRGLEWLLLDRHYVEVAPGGRTITSAGLQRGEMRSPRAA